jgi:hypothetical protein
MPTLWVLAFLLQGPVEWEGFGPGSSAEYTITGKRDGAAVRTTEKSLLKEVTESDVVVSLESVDAAGGRSRVDMKYPLPRRHVPKEEEGRKTGDESLTIDGKSYDCEIFERKGVRRWVCAAASANRGVLKTESISGSVQLITRVLKVEEKVAVGTNTVTCWVREEITDTGDQKTTRKSWISDEVPGGIVRSELKQVRNGETLVETVTTLTAFNVVKRGR